MRIAIGSDHAGFDQKEPIKRHLASEGHEVTDLGTFSDESVDYPDYALAVARAVAKGDADRGVLVCGTGIGMAIAANKVAGVRAANVTLPQLAALARQHTNANVITVSGRFVSLQDNLSIIEAFLSAEFEAGRHERRVEKIDAVDLGRA